MQQLRYGMEWLVGAPYEKFGDAGIGAGKGLGHLLPSIGDNLQAINNLGALNAGRHTFNWNSSAYADA